jgi:hypothetical protein
MPIGEQESILPEGPLPEKRQQDEMLAALPLPCSAWTQ